MLGKTHLPLPVTKITPTKWNLTSRATITVVGLFSKFWAKLMNRTVVYNVDKLNEAVDSRPPEIPLLTISNHTSCLDDPLLWGLLRLKTLVLQQELLRWNLAAAEICFTNPISAAFFSLGQCVPVNRGEGVYQQAVDFVLHKLNQGAWVHVFPEGKVNMGNELLRLKWGIGRLIAECQITPIILPMWHCGMDEVLPNKAPYIPRIGKKITVYIGNPIDLTDLVKNLKEAKLSPMDVRKKITDTVQDALYSLKDITDHLHHERFR